MERESYDHLEDAIRALERHATAIRSQGPLPGRKLIREFEPTELVAGRVEVSTGGILRGSTAGVDVKGDGTMVPFAGSVGRRTLDPLPGEDTFAAVARELG